MCSGNPNHGSKSLLLSIVTISWKEWEQVLSDISIVSVKNRVGIAQCVGIIFGPAYLNPLFAQVYTVNCMLLIFSKKILHNIYSLLL